METDAAAAVSARYARFAVDEAPGRSDLYAEWAGGVATDPVVAAILARIAPAHRQPPLVFAVSRLLGAPEQAYPHWAEWMRDHADALVDECGRRSIQTNEPLRCAALLPALGLVEGPIALLEIGASAGLCLYPDRYSYRYLDGDEVTRVDPRTGPSRVQLECELRGDRRPPVREMPEIVWRGGIDLAPLNATDPDDRRFLTTLVWPGETGRADRVRAALDVVAHEILVGDPPAVITGDATDPDLLARVAAMAPREATLVVTTPGVLPHIPREGRERLIDVVQNMDAEWITIDPGGLHDWDAALDPGERNEFLLGLNSRPLAVVDPLGGFVEWRHGTSKTAG
ncbi:DUF2332 domain-containing protein [Microbacterium rhizomatis]|uniref:DUF2332 domain-containing protein n=1 Tax=Microbacterium rhizomatis TaxID=1631477 RepID=A0A5J5J0J4_9MICO|nr:DUF2332 domain-containing protein [Microbacterium rhizomatis]KAA9107504.1 DUF2332 domain-containing protein [Microbacterium rhizomatis]